MPSTLFRFISRAEQLRLRGQRNFSRYMLITKGFVAGDSLERAQWKKEDAEEARRDAEWARRHGPFAGGASILPWRHKEEERTQHLSSAEATIR